MTRALRPAGVAGLLTIALTASSAPVGAAGPTTLDQTIVAEGERDLGFAPGEGRVTRTLLWEDPGGRGRRLVGFKQVSDIHVVDEESPGRIEYFDKCEQLPGHASAYRPQEAMSTQVGASMLRRLSAITEGPATGVPLSFLVSTGDNIDNNQLNETRWFVDLLDGKVVEPNSGADTYDGYTQAEFAEALDTSILELAQEPFKSPGAKGPWYAVLGNHDGLVQGNLPSNPAFQLLVTGDRKVFTSVDSYDADHGCPASIAEAVDKVFPHFVFQGRTVPDDPNRRFITHRRLVKEYFNTSGTPVGHGFARAPTDPLHDARAGYYSWPLGRKVRGISLDTISYDGGPAGAIPHPQYKWLRRQLKKWSRRYYSPEGELLKNEEGRNRLVVLFSHHSSVSLNNPGQLAEAMPYHCFSQADLPQREGTSCAEGEGLGGLIDRFPNVLAWVNGHEHNNAVRPYGTDPDRGFWEINTAAHIDWPQQSRLIEIAWKPGTDGSPDTVFIYGTIVDHAAAPDPDEASQPKVQYLASLSRVEAYYDACVRTAQADCAAAGDPEDRNVRLVSKAPFNLGN
jgi:metallophosphoesterase (TIGR03767 family)